MKVLSLNINNFGGRDSYKPLLKDYNNSLEFRKAVISWRDSSNHYKNASCVLNLIREKNPDIVFLQEFDVTSDTSSKFIKSMRILGYIEKYPDNNATDSIKGTKSITIMFTKLRNIVVRSNKDLVAESLKWVNLEVGDILISGVHSNYDMEYWDALERFYLSNKDRKLLVIGDLNVHIKGTDRREGLDRVLSLGLIDTWTYLGGSDKIATCYTGARLDYALSSRKLVDNLSIEIDDSSIKNYFSDHNALIVEVH